MKDELLSLGNNSPVSMVPLVDINVLRAIMFFDEPTFSIEFLSSTWEIAVLFNKRYKMTKNVFVLDGWMVQKTIFCSFPVRHLTLGQHFG